MLNSSEIVEKGRVLSCMFSHLRTVEELRDAHILEKALSSPCLHHKFSGELGGLAWLERSQLDGFVQRIAWDD